MLKRVDSPPPDPDSLSNLFGRAKEEARAWAAAEVTLYRTIATEKARQWKAPFILFTVALFLGHAALLVLVATLFVALAQVMNAALAGLVSTLLLTGAAGLMVKIALGKIKGAAK